MEYPFLNKVLDDYSSVDSTEYDMSTLHSALTKRGYDFVGCGAFATVYSHRHYPMQVVKVMSKGWISSWPWENQTKIRAFPDVMSENCRDLFNLSAFLYSCMVERNSFDPEVHGMASVKMKTAGSSETVIFICVMERLQPMIGHRPVGRVFSELQLALPDRFETIQYSSYDRNSFKHFIRKAKLNTKYNKQIRDMRKAIFRRSFNTPFGIIMDVQASNIMVRANEEPVLTDVFY